MSWVIWHCQKTNFVLTSPKMSNECIWRFTSNANVRVNFLSWWASHYRCWTSLATTNNCGHEFHIHFQTWMSVQRCLSCKWGIVAKLPHFSSKIFTAKMDGFNVLRSRSSTFLLSKKGEVAIARTKQNGARGDQSMQSSSSKIHALTQSRWKRGRLVLRKECFHQCWGQMFIAWTLVVFVETVWRKTTRLTQNLAQAKYCDIFSNYHPHGQVMHEAGDIPPSPIVCFQWPSMNLFASVGPTIVHTSNYYQRKKINSVNRMQVRPYSIEGHVKSLTCLLVVGDNASRSS